MKYKKGDVKVIQRDSIDYSSVDISRDGFEENLRQASIVARDFCSTFVFNALPDKVVYKIYSGILKKEFLEDGEIVFEDAIYNGEKTIENEEEVVSTLWRNGYAPVWINVSVEAQTEEFTIISLLCGGRFSSKVELMYHVHEGRAPFHVLGPPLPPQWESVEKDGKFDLHWQKNA